VTLESAFPWISAASALATGFAAPDSRSGRALRTLALTALGLYAYFRGISPTSVPMALACQALGQAALPEDARRWRRWAIGLPVLGWLILANLYRNTGEGAGVFLGDGIKAALLAALVIGAGYAAWRFWRQVPERRIAVAAEAVALVAMGAFSLTLDWDFWPVMAGALLALASFVLALYANRKADQLPSRSLSRAIWGLSFVGQAIMAYAFLY
jgi:hypothetical protein